MRNVARKKEEIIYPDKNRDPEEYLSVYYSVPQWLVKTMGTNLRNRNNGMHVKRFFDGSSVDDPMPAVSGGAGIDGQQSERPGSNG